MERHRLRIDRKVVLPRKADGESHPFSLGKHSRVFARFENLFRSFVKKEEDITIYSPLSAFLIAGTGLIFAENLLDSTSPSIFLTVSPPQEHPLRELGRRVMEKRHSDGSFPSFIHPMSLLKGIPVNLLLLRRTSIPWRGIGNAWEEYRRRKGIITVKRKSFSLEGGSFLILSKGASLFPSINVRKRNRFRRRIGEAISLFSEECSGKRNTDFFLSILRNLLRSC